MSSNQEAFDIVWNGIRKQGGPSTGKNGNGCMYRGEGGAKCAVGQLMSDEDYKIEFDEHAKEPYSIGMAFTVVIDACPSLQKYDRSFLVDLQSIHDGAKCNKKSKHSFIEIWEASMRTLALNYKLVIPS